jgi:hypothetical protein
MSYRIAIDIGGTFTDGVIDELAISGRILHYIPLKFARIDKIAANLKALGASQEEIEKATATIYQRVTHDHLERIAGTLKGANPGMDDALFNQVTAHEEKEGNSAVISYRNAVRAPKDGRSAQAVDD